VAKNHRMPEICRWVSAKKAPRVDHRTPSPPGGSPIREVRSQEPGGRDSNETPGTKFK